MKLILDLDETTIKNMQGYTALHGITINELVTKLFIKYIQEPANVIDAIDEVNGDLKELEMFSELLMHYVNEATLDIEGSAKSSEAYEADERMAYVFKKLNRDHLQAPHILTDLYLAYKEGN